MASGCGDGDAPVSAASVAALAGKRQRVMLALTQLNSLYRVVSERDKQRQWQEHEREHELRELEAAAAEADRVAAAQRRERRSKMQRRRESGFVAALRDKLMACSIGAGGAHDDDEAGDDDNMQDVLVHVNSALFSPSRRKRSNGFGQGESSSADAAATADSNNDVDDEPEQPSLILPSTRSFIVRLPRNHNLLKSGEYVDESDFFFSHSHLVELFYSHFSNRFYATCFPLHLKI